MQLVATTSKEVTFEEHTRLREGEGVWDAIASSVQLGHNSLQAAVLLYELHGSHTPNPCTTRMPCITYLAVLANTLYLHSS